MLSRKIRPDLETLRSHLASWSEEVPDRAVEFRRLCGDLAGQVSALLRRLVLRPGQAELASLERQVESLGDLAPALVTLLRQAEAVEHEVADLRAAAERSPDRELASWLTERCVNWQSALRRLGSNVGRLAEMDQDQAALDRTREQVRRHAEALRVLEKAAELLDTLGDRMETAVLKADLPSLRQRLFEEGASAAWLAEVEHAVRPLRLIVDLPPKAPPQTLEEVDSLLDRDIRPWMRALGVDEERADALQERLQIAKAEWEDWSDDQIQELLQDTEQCLDGLRRLAAERRAAALSDLRERFRLLAAACGPDPELEREIGELEKAGAAEPDDYEDWMRRAEGVESRLLSFAGARAGDLRAWIAKRRQDLGARLDALEAEPVSSGTAGHLVRLRVDLEDLLKHRAEDLALLFKDLATCNRIALDLDRLEEQVRADRKAFEEARQRLLDRHESLQEEVKRCAIEVSDPTARLAALAEPAPGMSLDDLHARAEELELELAALEKKFAEGRAAWVNKRLDCLCRQVALLCRAGRPAVEVPEPLSSGLTPAQAADAVVRVRELDKDLARQLEEVRLELEVRCHGFRGQLAALPVQSLRSEVRRDAVEIFRLLGEEAWEGLDPEDRLEKMLLALERCDAFLAKLSQDDREAQRQAEDLRWRLRRFNEMDLDRFCPVELVQRASALVAGIPPQPPSWGALADHLAAAEELLGRLENHARRVRAAQLERAIPDLERQASLSRDPAYAKRLRALLHEVAVWDQRQELPAQLMAQIFILAPEPHWGGDP